MRAGRIRLALVTTVWFAGNAAPLAAQEFPRRFYFGAGVDFAGHTARQDGLEFEASPAGAAVYGGVQLRERIAIEGALLAQPNVSSGEMAGSGVQRLRIDSGVSLLIVRSVLSLYLGDGFPGAARWTLFGTAGAFAAADSRRVAERTTATSSSVSIDDSGLALGAGVLYDLKRVRLRAALEQRDGRQIDQTAFGIAAEFRF